MKRPFLPAFLAFSALGSSPGADVLLEATTTTGEAGDAVVLQFRGTLSQPVAGFRIYFQLSEKIALFLRTEIFDTASFTPSANYLSLIDHATGAFITGVESTLISPGDNLLLAKAILYLDPGAPPGEVAINVLSAEFTGKDGEALSVEMGDEAVLRLLPRTRPDPVKGFRCMQSGEEVLLTWRNTEVYDSLLLGRGGGAYVRLNGADTSFRDHPPPGQVDYYLSAVRGGKESLTARAGIQVRQILLPEIENLNCTSDKEGNHLRWENGGIYDSILVLRNDHEIALLEGSARSFDDPIRSRFSIMMVSARPAWMPPTLMTQAAWTSRTRSRCSNTSSREEGGFLPPAREPPGSTRRPTNCPAILLGRWGPPPV